MSTQQGSARQAKTGSGWRAWLGAVLLLVGTSPLSQATDLTWTGASNDSWFVDTNWSPNAIPGNDDQVFIFSGGVYLATNGTYSATTNLTISGDPAFLVVYGGATVFNTFGSVNIASNANLNVVVLSEMNVAGSVLVGSNGGSAELLVSSGGQLSSTFGFLGYDAGSDQNLATVRDDSVWTISSNLYVGAVGAGNTLEILEGGIVSNVTGYIGFDGNSSNNQVVVHGAGSLWNNSGDLSVGLFGDGNSLTVSNAGQVLVGNDVYVGQFSSGNSVLVQGAGSLLQAGDDLYIGENGTANRLEVSNQGAVTVGVDLVVGLEDGTNALVVSAGGTVEASWIYVGGLSNSMGNSVLVTGPGSVLGNGTMYVGYGGGQNSLTISNGGRAALSLLWVGNFSASNQVSVLGSNSSLATDYGFVGGYGSNAVGNSVLVSGPGSVWSNRLEIYVGYSADQNSLVISNGGRVESGSLLVGATGADNHLSVIGSNSSLLVAEDLTIGTLEPSNTLTVVGGGLVSSGTGIIGKFDGSYDNSVLVSGPGSTWSLTNGLSVGLGGAGNSLVISNRGQLFSQSATIGGEATAADNTVIVTGLGSTWSNTGSLTIGQAGAGNALHVLDGGLVQAGSVYLGLEESSSNNWLTINGGLLFFDDLLDVRRGTVLVQSNAVLSGNGPLYFTNGTDSVFQLLGGLAAGTYLVLSNGSDFAIGDGSQSAGLYLNDGTSSFQNSLAVSNNAVLSLAHTSRVQVGGDFELVAGGTFATTIASASQVGRIDVDGSVTLAGDLVVNDNGYTPLNQDANVLITALGGGSGAFSNVTIDLVYSPLLDPQLQYNPNDVTLYWGHLSFTNWALTPNQRATARGLDSLTNDANQASKDLINALDQLALDQGTNAIPPALDRIAPEEYAALFELAINGLEGLGGRLQGRLQRLRHGSRGLDTAGLNLYTGSEFGGAEPVYYSVGAQAAPFADGILSPRADNPWGVYLEGLGEFQSLEADGNSTGFDLNSYGFSLGVDRRLSDTFVVGILAGYSDETAELTGSGEVNLDAARGAIYAAYYQDGVHFEAMFGGGLNSYDTRRQGLLGVQQGETDGYVWGGLLSGGMTYQEGRWFWGPQLTLQYSSAHIDGFAEQGSLDNLVFPAQTRSQLHSLLGASLAYQGLVGNKPFTPVLSVAWRHDYLDRSLGVNARFASPASELFQVKGPRVGRDSAVINLGASLDLTEALGVYLRYSTELGRSGYDSHNISGGVNYRF